MSGISRYSPGHTPPRDLPPMGGTASGSSGGQGSSAAGPSSGSLFGGPARRSPGAPSPRNAALPGGQPAAQVPTPNMETATYHDLVGHYGYVHAMTPQQRGELAQLLRTMRPEQFSLSGRHTASGQRENLLHHVMDGINFPTPVSANNLHSVLADVDCLRTMVLAAASSRFSEVRAAAKHSSLHDTSVFVAGKLKPLLYNVSSLAFNPHQPEQTRLQSQHVLQQLVRMPNDELAEASATYLMQLAAATRNNDVRWRLANEFVMPAVLGEGNNFRFNAFSHAHQADLFFTTLDAMRGTGHDPATLQWGAQMEPHLHASLRPFARECMRGIREGQAPVGNFSYREQVRNQFGL